MEGFVSYEDKFVVNARGYREPMEFFQEGSDGIVGSTQQKIYAADKRILESLQTRDEVVRYSKEEVVAVVKMWEDIRGGNGNGY